MFAGFQTFQIQMLLLSKVPVKSTILGKVQINQTSFSEGV